MITAIVERDGDDVVLRLNAQAAAVLRLEHGSSVELSLAPTGGVAVAAEDLDHKMRHDRGRAFLRRVRQSG